MVHTEEKPKVVSTHSRPKAAGLGYSDRIAQTVVSTHSRPKAAGACVSLCYNIGEFQHTAARRRLVGLRGAVRLSRGFQHTAARRRLVKIMQHSGIIFSFNTQPPEGGWACRL